MSSVVYSLKNGINRTNNPTTGGVFAYGSYTSAGAFTLFTDYEYEDGTPFVAEPFDATQPLVWKGATQYPHLGFENLTPNSAITPQPFPSFGIYLHPFIVAGVRQDVGVRVTIPFSGDISIASTIQRADLTCGDDIGYRIMKNGVAIQARQFIQPSSTPSTINTPSTPFIAGDIIDFIVDIGSQTNSFCDDTALEVSLVYEYSKIPTPTITTTPVICSTTIINGTTPFIAEGTIAELYLDSTLLKSTSVALDLITYKGSFSFTGLDLTEYEGKVLKVILRKSGDIDSDPATITVGAGGCVTIVLEAPVVTSIDLCDKIYQYRRVLSGTSTESGDMAIYEYPYTAGDPIIAAGRVQDGLITKTFSIQSENFETSTRYVAVLVNYNGDVGSTEINFVNDCNKGVVLCGRLKGYVNGVTNGIINVYEETDLINPVITDIIRNELFDILSPLLTTEVNYILIATKLD